jgi:hypothetical protein
MLLIWTILNPESSELGDPVDDLSVATVLMMVGGKLVLLRPRKVDKPLHLQYGG